MADLHNLDSLHDQTWFPHPVEVEAVVVTDVQAEEVYRTITYAESEADGETFLLRAPRRTEVANEIHDLRR